MKKSRKKWYHDEDVAHKMTVYFNIFSVLLKNFTMRYVNGNPIVIVGGVGCLR